VREKGVHLSVLNKQRSRHFDPLAIDPAACFRTLESDNAADVIRNADAAEGDV
jgi:hypothetical protein